MSTASRKDFYRLLRERCRETGRCIECPLPADAGQLRCRSHRERNIARAKKHRSGGVQTHRCSRCGVAGHNARTCMEGQKP